eukprot:Gregarina_sp_Poly_1__827@NODE_1199_length_4801_cov_10_399662_g824_i0_p2_GENE_NODE_1199_length_4801_cov_10_399662_g824_i0NODE_1199_length_4801_cov_10_399662_g824_i0_p2_ORF_typecomplete_len139_score19_05_NODE_1199_length_4801_cov_10_399662_g824_i0553969
MTSVKHLLFHKKLNAAVKYLGQRKLADESDLLPEQMPSASNRSRRSQPSGVLSSVLSYQCPSRLVAPLRVSLVPEIRGVYCFWCDSLFDFEVVTVVCFKNVPHHWRLLASATSLAFIGDAGLCIFKGILKIFKVNFGQ